MPFRALKSKPFLLSVGAGACTAAYSLINKENLKAVEPFTLYYLIVTCMTVLLTAILLFGNNIREIGEEFKSNFKGLLLMGIFGFASAALFLYALKMSKVSYLGAARNVSIVFGVVLGSLYLHEGYGKIRTLASLLILAGIFLLSVS